MNFGKAIEELKKGKTIGRSIWLGKSNISLKKGVINCAYVLEEECAGEKPLTTVDGIKSALFEPLAGDLVTIYPSLRYFGYNSETHMCISDSWLPSAQDILAEDWEVVA